MAELLLFHHALGLTSGVQDFAECLRQAGHTVHVPDVYEGHIFNELEEGITYAETTGFDKIIERSVAAAGGLPNGLVYAGFSLGVLPAQKLAQTRSGAQGAILFHSCVPVQAFGEAWPPSVPVQIHAMDGDKFFTDEDDIDAARALVESVQAAELFLYPGTEHLFADNSLPSYDEGATALLIERTLRFLEPGG